MRAELLLEAVTAGWTSAHLHAGLEGELCSDSASRPRGRAAELWQVPPSGTSGADDRARALTAAAAVGSETVGDGESAVLAGSAAGGLSGRVRLTMFTGTGDNGRPVSSRALFLQEHTGGTRIEAMFVCFFMVFQKSVVDITLPRMDLCYLKAGRRGPLCAPETDPFLGSGMKVLHQHTLNILDTGIDGGQKIGENRA